MNKGLVGYHYVLTFVSCPDKIRELTFGLVSNLFELTTIELCRCNSLVIEGMIFDLWFWQQVIILIDPYYPHWARVMDYSPISIQYNDKISISWNSEYDLSRLQNRRRETGSKRLALILKCEHVLNNISKIQISKEFRYLLHLDIDRIQLLLFSSLSRRLIFSPYKPEYIKAANEIPNRKEFSYRIPNRLFLLFYSISESCYSISTHIGHRTWSAVVDNDFRL